MSLEDQELLEINADSEEEINRILASGDPDAIAKLLERAETAEAMDDAPLSDELDADEEPKLEAEPEEVDEEEKAAEPAASTKEGVDAQSPGAEEEDGEGQSYIVPKSGKGRIPYAVLDTARKDLARTKQELAEARAKLDSQLDRTQVEAKLKERGIDIAEVLDSGEEISAQMLAEVESLDPALGKVFRIMAKKLEAQTQQQAAVEANSNAGTITAVQSALAMNPELQRWSTEDQDRFDAAIAHDNELKTDPKWAAKPMHLRFAEAERRTRLDFGDLVDAPKAPPVALKTKAKAALSKAQDEDVPRSLTDIGQSTPKEKTRLERMTSMSKNELTAELENMSDDAREEFLSRLPL